MARFGIKSVGTKVVDYPVYGLGMKVDPILKVRPASDANKDYRDAQLRYFPNQSRRRRTPSNVEIAKMGTSMDLDLYPKHVIVGWSGFVDESTKQEPDFNESNVRDLLKEMEEAGIFGELRNFCSEPLNFEDGPDAGEVGND